MNYSLKSNRAQTSQEAMNVWRIHLIHIVTSANKFKKRGPINLAWALRGKYGERKWSCQEKEYSGKGLMKKVLFPMVALAKKFDIFNLGIFSIKLSHIKRFAEKSMPFRLLN